MNRSKPDINPILEMLILLAFGALLFLPLWLATTFIAPPPQANTDNTHIEADK